LYSGTQAFARNLSGIEISDSKNSRSWPKQRLKSSRGE
jgi:hypothetical protein